MDELVQKHHQMIQWLLGGTTLLLALAAWLQNGRLTDGFSLYDLFPLLGLVAFGLMWAAYILDAIGRYTRTPAMSRGVYIEVSMGLVLALILLHPALLTIALLADGMGAPPGSYLTVYSAQQWAILLGMTALMIFLAYELRRWFQDRKWWSYVEWAQVFAMTLIFFHALELGGELDIVWFKTIWWLYGITLLAALVYANVIAPKKEVSNGKEIK